MKRIKTSKKHTLRGTNKLQLLSMLAIPMLLVFVFNYIPMFGLIIAFKDYRFDTGIWGSAWNGLKNFRMFFMSPDFVRVAWNTVFLNFIFIFIGMACAVFMAIVLYQIRSRIAVKTYETLLITPHFLSWVVVGYITYALLNPDFGFLNSIIEKFGGEPVQWYSRPELWPGILTIVSIWKHVGMDLVIYYAALMGIDQSLFEAAKIDGASSAKCIRHIMIPSLVPLIIIMGILKIGNIFRGDFGMFYQITRDLGVLYETTDVMDTYIFRMLRVNGNVSISSAAGFLQSIVGFITVVITNAVVKRINPDYALY